MANLFGPSPTEIMAARQKELEDRQQAEYMAMLQTAQTPAERTYMMAGRTLSQALSPLIGGGAGANDPMLQQARVTQTILSKYGPDSLNDPEALSAMSRDFASFGMNNEAIQLAGRATDLRKNQPDAYITATGADIMDKFKGQITGLNKEATYRVNVKTGDVKELDSNLTVGTIPPGFRLVKTAQGIELQPITNRAEEERQFRTAVDTASKASFSRRNIADAMRIIEDNGWLRVWNGVLFRLMTPDTWLGKIVPTEAGNLVGTVQSLNSQIALQSLADLKELSKSGASGLGAVNMREWGALESALRSLDPKKLTITALYKNLKEIDQHFKNIIDAAINQEDPAKASEAVKILKQSGFIPEDYFPDGGMSIQEKNQDPLGLL